ncbi:hypothetical protein BU23DRAFT_86980 [Bimuria novae-zelandiae CBS 107.79]|uniref:tRNA(Ile)-lysidine synthetase n=1 Tax=Bimuria novae-zelandiae CBS 107.79 TaxID=1447943 RepID=A0A6A5VD34_9PLEO|nr:hypothetical protein BU23DRAFT_86980 [Bimuria novae-zelandiae CBS 107.79]
MWTRNVACLRSCSSARVHLQHASVRSCSLERTQDANHAPFRTAPRLAHTQSALLQGEGAIGDDEFLDALYSVLPRVHRQQQPRPVGLAVSGGVDSMALATLYANCYADAPLPNLHGFIIDHKARPESTEEAHWVAEQLSTSVGFQSTIIPLTWLQGFDPTRNIRFETEARRMRYQALGTACRDKGINSLLLAHHADDQAETVLMRLLHGRLRSGLQGMKSVEWIPECYGIYGVHHSGSPPPRGDSTLALVEHGGIEILRPLLRFEKSRLIATCERHNTRWAEDKTNQDPTLTLRNALRYVVNNHQLPKALSKEPLLNVAHTIQSRVEKYQAAAEALFNACPLRLDIKTASLVVRLPPVDALFPAAVFVPSPSDKVQARNTAQFLLERVVDLVSPMEKPTKESVANAVLSVYPSLAPDSSEVVQRKSFTCCNCWWKKSTSSSALKRAEGDPPVDQLNEWMLARAPLSREEVGSHSIDFPPGRQSDWHLLDGRFWIRVNNLNDRNILLKTITDEQLNELLQINSNSKFRGDPLDPEAALHDLRKNIRAVLMKTKPHTVRRHLPALFLAPPPDNPDAEPTLLAIPTLQSSPQPGSRAEEHLKCAWQVRYKKIDPGSRALFQILAREKRPTTSSDSSTRPRKVTKARRPTGTTYKRTVV